MAPLSSSNTSNPDGSSGAQNAGDRRRPEAITPDPNLIIHRTREGIMPDDGHRKTGNISSFWKVKVTLLPSASWTTRPEKDSDEYLRLKSRGLISTALIEGRDSASINNQISNLFLTALRGRKWMPLQALQDPTTSEIYLSPLGSSDHVRDRDFNFLADTCLIQNEKEKLYLFIAPASDHLTWNFIQRLPRKFARSYKIEEEDFWGFDNSDGQNLDDDNTNQPNPSRYILEAASNQLTYNSPSCLTPTSLPPSHTVISTTDTPEGNKGKYVCPFSGCPRSRVPFKNGINLTEHISRHGLAYKGNVTSDYTSLRPLASKESDDPKPAMASFRPLQSFTKSVSWPSEPLHGPNDIVLNRQRRSVASTSPGALPQESQKQFEQKLNLDYESAPPAFRNSEKTRDCTIASNIVDTMALFSHLPFRTLAGESSGSSSNDNHSSSIHIGTPNRTNGSHKRRRTERGDKQQNNDDDSGNDDNDPRKTGNGQNVQANPLRMFACPFYKHNAKKYGSCADLKWGNIHRMKEHLYRKHLLPRYHCRRCHERFEKEEDLDGHVKAEQPCLVSSEPDNAEGVTNEQERRLRSRKNFVNVKESYKWNRVYKILFTSSDDDDAFDIPSPWYEPQQLVNVNEFRHFLCNPQPLTYQQDTKKKLVKKIDDLLASSLGDRDGIVDGLMKLFHTHQIESLDQYIQTLPGKGPPPDKTSDEAFAPQTINKAGPHCRPVFTTSPAASGPLEFCLDDLGAGDFSIQSQLDNHTENPVDLSLPAYGYPELDDGGKTPGRTCNDNEPIPHYNLILATPPSTDKFSFQDNDSFFRSPPIDSKDDEYDLADLNAGNYSLSSQCYGYPGNAIDPSLSTRLPPELGGDESQGKGHRSG